ncbi:MAG: phosphatidylglycerol lysyltransferase domain-containing protein [Candidatus Omnitrophica bacterium]|nr:phosphatidylglycerol lysyltransferase domain-containing protein [Candidatus Omnitrophota bacterium]MDD5500885.1 phosphatidylglycerol lysyltransferase domain-containing protein [Candidatus Omnitrophota bacterium]
MNKLTLDDRALFDKYLGSSRHNLSVFSFPGIYIWRPLFDIRWAASDGNLCVFFTDRLSRFMYLPPLGRRPGSAILKSVFSVMDEVNKNRDISRIENIGEEERGIYLNLGCCCCRKYPDYVCLRDSLASLKGNKFKPQRALRNHFLKNQDSRVRKLAEQDKQECLGLFDRWSGARREKYREALYCGMLEDSRKVLEEAFSCYKSLGLEGIAVTIEGKIRGFTFGYRLNRDTFCVLYEITDLSVKGLAQFIFSEFSINLRGYKYINIMDDSGLENLRKTKLSYKPERLIEAYIATRNA